MQLMNRASSSALSAYDLSAEGDRIDRRASAGCHASPLLPLFSRVVSVYILRVFLKRFPAEPIIAVGYVGE